MDLKDILCPSILFGIDTTDIKYSKILLKEQKPTKLKPITLYIPTHDCIVFTLDHPKNGYAQKSSYLKKTKADIHQGCDYVIACNHKGKLNFVLIELKSDKTAGANSQLLHSTPFINYLISLIKIHYPNCPFSEYSIKYLLFSTNPAHQTKILTSQNNVFKVPDDRGFEVYIGGNPNNFYLKTVLQ